MPEPFLRLAPDERASIILAASERLGLAPGVLEKDVWVCWVLEQLFGMTGRPRMAFKGGTSLSKVFGAIHRFSEDVDVTIDFRDLHPSFDPYRPDVSRTRFGRFSERLKELLRDHVHGTVKPFLERQLAQQVQLTTSSGVEVSRYGERLWVSYPASLDEGGEYVSSRVLVEFGGRNVSEPNVAAVVRPYIAEVVEADLAYPTATVDVLAPERTFWEKATLIHVACNRGDLATNVQRTARHWYDLAMLDRHDIGARALADRQLLADVVRHKQRFFNHRLADYEACLTGRLRLTPEAPQLARLERDYASMIASGMFYVDPPPFADIVERLRDLQTRANRAA